MRAKHAATLFLKGVLLLMTFGVMALYVFGLPGMAERDAAASGNGISSIPVFDIGLYLLCPNPGHVLSNLQTARLH